MARITRGPWMLQELDRRFRAAGTKASAVSLHPGAAAQKKRVEGASQIWLWSLILCSVSENSVPLNPMVNDHYPY